MKIKHLLFYGLFVFICSDSLIAQRVNVTAETDSFTDYELVNDSDRISPPYQLLVPVVNGEPAFKILEQSIVEIDRSLSESEISAAFISSDEVNVIETAGIGIYRGHKKAQILFHRVRYTPKSLLITKKLKVRVYKNDGDRVFSSKKRNFADSPLSTGTWYKIPVRDNNIYKLDFSYLSDLGINVGSIDPRNIQIWGTNGFPLPELSGASRPSLAQIPIIVEGENDGSFDSNDRVIFYGNSPHQVLRNQDKFVHNLHPYSDVKYVFLTVTNGNGLRLTPSNNGLNPTSTVNSFTDFLWKDEELTKPEDKFKSGRYWLGQSISSTQSNVPVSIFRDTLVGVSSPLNINVTSRLYARSEALITFDTDLNNVDVAQNNVFSLSSTSSSRGYNGSEGPAASPYNINEDITISVNDGILDLTTSVTHRQQNSIAFVDWVRLTFERSLTAESNRLLFYTINDTLPPEQVTFLLNGFSTDPYIMDVTDPSAPSLLQYSTSGNNIDVNYFQNSGRTIIAQSVFPTPGPGERIVNQNLTGIINYPDYIVVTSEDLKNEALELANYRDQQGLSPLLVTQSEIFNEFSGGTKDPTAIRDYVKFLWERAISAGETEPQYLLLFGDTTYDTKNIIENALTNHVLTYQSQQSTVRATGSGGGTFGTDDFFGYLDDNEGDIGSGNTENSFLMDIGIGRITAQTSTEASNFIDKIKRYEAQTNAGEWQNLFTFAADDDFPDQNRNRDIHTINADVSAEMMALNEPGIRLNKIYEFSYPAEITGAGRQIPEATEDFLRAVNNGTLVLNYSGHGNEQTLSDEELFLSEYITGFTNTDKLCVLVTATCQFGRYDDTSDQSGAERFVSANNGGGIASFTTTRVVYTNSSVSSNNNFGLNLALSQRMSERKPDGTPKRLGDIMRETKNSIVGSGTSRVGSSTNNKKFVLLGDPATIFKLPSQKAVVTSINGIDVLNQDTTVTLRALDQVTLSGIIQTSSGQIDNSYTGELVLSIFDARRKVSLPEREWNCVLNGDCTYNVETDLLFKGKVSVQHGVFDQTFIVPKDISTSSENGRVVLYAKGSNQYAGGAYTDLTFEGVNPEAVNDGTGPSMNIYLNDEKFVNGNLVSDSPKLIVELQDNSGINTTGTGVGHEIIATIDTKPTQTFILNEFYEGNLNDFSGGRIEYPLDQLPEGSYTLKVRAWDVHNNPNEKEIFFEVAPKNELSVRNIYNYPNPMNSRTQFTFEHNQPGNPLDVSIKIYTLSGKPVHHIKQESLITSNSYANISWNGRDRDNDRLGNGTYIYVLRVAAETPEGKQSIEKIEKLVIIR
ncbi:MAG: type IX secretion system sortase PorU [Balneola sp.]